MFIVKDGSDKTRLFKVIEVIAQKFAEDPEDKLQCHFVTFLCEHIEKIEFPYKPKHRAGARCVQVVCFGYDGYPNTSAVRIVEDDMLWDHFEKVRQEREETIRGCIEGERIYAELVSARKKV